MAQDVVVADIQEMPVSSRDYPRNWEQFLDWFPDDDACIEYLEGIRWPDGFTCPRCGVVDAAYRTSRGRLIAAIADINALSPPVPFLRRPARHCEVGLRRCGISSIRSRE